MKKSALGLALLVLSLTVDVNAASDSLGVTDSSVVTGPEYKYYVIGISKHPGYPNLVIPFKTWTSCQKNVKYVKTFRYQSGNLKYPDAYCTEM